MFLDPGVLDAGGGYGTIWFNDLTAIAMIQTVDFLVNGSADEFSRLAAAAAR